MTAKKKVKEFIINNVNGLGLGKILDQGQSLEDVVQYWYFIKHILIPNKKYNVYQTPEFICQRRSFNKKTEKTIKFVEKIFADGSSGGISINKLMSNNIRDKPEYFDKMLQLMKIHHIHLDANFGMKRSSELLFVATMRSDWVAFLYLGNHHDLCDPKILEISYKSCPVLYRMKMATIPGTSKLTKEEILANDWCSMLYPMDDGFSVMMRQPAFNVLDNQKNIVRGKGGHIKSTHSYGDWALDALDRIDAFKNLKIIEVSNEGHVLHVSLTTSEYTKKEYFDSQPLHKFYPELLTFNRESWKLLSDSDPLPIKIILG